MLHEYANDAPQRLTAHDTGVIERTPPAWQDCALAAQRAQAC